MKRQKIFLTLALLVAITAAFQIQQSAFAQAGSAYDLINEVNGLRASNGLPPLEIDPALMASAQGHSDYMSSIDSLTHSGLGGSRPRDRAVAAGYGAGAAVFIAENIAGANNLTAHDAVYTTWTDSLNLSTMTNSAYTHIGAGVAVSGPFVYYTLDVGYISGKPGSEPTAAPTSPNQAPADTSSPAPTEAPAYIVQTAAPLPDGSIMHEVKQGQSLWSIAIAYGVNIDDLQKLNNLGSSEVVWPGDKLIIAPSFTPTVSPTVTQTPKPPTRTPRPTSTQRPATPTRTPTAEVTLTQQAVSPASLVLSAPSGGLISRHTLGMSIIVVCAIGVILVLVGGLKKE